MTFDKPVITEHDISEILLLFFNDTSSVKKITNLGGIPNNNFFVRINSKNIVLKIYSKGQSTIDHIENEVRFTMFMGSRGIHTLSLIPGRDGNYIQYWKGYPVVCTSFISGRRLSELGIDAAIARSVGEYTALFEKTAAEFIIPSLRPANLSEVVEYVFQDVDKKTLECKTCTELDYILAIWNEISPEIEVLQRSYCPQMVHMDLWPYNFILHRNSLYSIDYDDWLFTSPIFEISVVLLEFCMFNCNVFNWEIAKEILSGYCCESDFKYSGKDIHLALQFICVLWYGYNLVESSVYEHAQIYYKKLAVISCEEFHQQIELLLETFR